MGGWNVLDDEPSYLAKYIETAYVIPDKGTGNAPIVPQETTMVNIDKMLDYAEGKTWKVRKECTINSPEVQNIIVGFDGFSGVLKNMLAEGWKAELVTNDFTKRTKLYIFHPTWHLIGRGVWDNHAVDYDKYITLDFLGHCKEFKRRYRGTPNVNIRSFTGGEYIAPLDMSVEELLLVCAAKLKGQIPPKKKIKVETPSNVIDLLERVKQRIAESKLTAPVEEKKHVV